MESGAGESLVADDGTGLKGDSSHAQDSDKESSIAGGVVEP